MSDSDGQLPYLDTFSKAAELSSFTATGKALGMTQAAVSQRIHALEKELGVTNLSAQRLNYVVAVGFHLLAALFQSRRSEG